MAAAIVPFISFSATPAAAGVADCNKGPRNLCFWSGKNYTGEFAGSTQIINQCFSVDRPWSANSGWNVSNYKLTVYHGAVCKGSSKIIPKGQKAPTFPFTVSSYKLT
ncbi:peptidase inhibitor family I36 protein [Streptomyces sp. NPDC004728]|uniref:peptidase inhibitor family I36 protein n=1 Tax=Streptomyces sp. NPDC004728 TaxID=3154289 RepID=UPI0033A09A7B